VPSRPSAADARREPEPPLQRRRPAPPRRLRDDASDDAGSDFGQESGDDAAQEALEAEALAQLQDAQAARPRRQMSRKLPTLKGGNGALWTALADAQGRLPKASAARKGAASLVCIDAFAALAGNWQPDDAPTLPSVIEDAWAAAGLDVCDEATRSGLVDVVAAFYHINKRPPIPGEGYVLYQVIELLQEQARAARRQRGGGGRRRAATLLTAARRVHRARRDAYNAAMRDADARMRRGEFGCVCQNCVLEQFLWLKRRPHLSQTPPLRGVVVTRLSRGRGFKVENRNEDQTSLEDFCRDHLDLSRVIRALLCHYCNPMTFTQADEFNDADYEDLLVREQANINDLDEDFPELSDDSGSDDDSESDSEGE